MTRVLTIYQPVGEPEAASRLAPLPEKLEGTRVGIQGGVGTRVASGQDNFGIFMREVERRLREEYGVVDAVWWTDAHGGEGRAGTATHPEKYTNDVREFAAKVDWAIAGVGV